MPLKCLEERSLIQTNLPATNLDEVNDKSQAPGLAVVLVGSRGDSATYVRSKKKACADVGIESFGTELPEDGTEEELLKACQPAPFTAAINCQ